METKITDKGKSQKEIDVTLSPKEVNNFFKKTAEKISSEKQFKGFRAGKAPTAVVKDSIGEEEFWQEACYEALKGTYPQIIKESGLAVISAPEVNITKMASGNPFSFKIVVSILPEFKLPDYKSIADKVLKKEKKESVVSPEETDKAIDEIRKSRAKTSQVARGSKKGDEIVINYTGSVDGAEQTGLKQDDLRIILGETSFIKGFSENLEGLKEGETKEFTLNVPLTGPEQKVTEKEVSFSVKVVSVYERELPEINDDFAKSLGKFSNLEDLRAKIGENIMSEKERKEKEKTRLKVVEVIASKTPFEIPKPMIEKEMENMIDDFKHRLKHSGISLDSYLKSLGKREDEFREGTREEAEKRIKTSLILKKIAEIENIKASDEEIEKEKSHYYKHSGAPKTTGKGDSERITLYFKDLIENEKVFNLLESRQ